MKRRALLATGAAIAVGGGLIVAGLGPRLLAARKRARLLRDLGPGIGALIEAADSAGATGERLTVLGSNMASLAARLQAGLALPAGNIPTPEQAQALVSAAISDDFASGRVITADGWVLSETETNLARLRWLVSGKVRTKGPAKETSLVITQVEDWGPRRIVQGMPFNGERDHSLWFKSGEAPPWLVVRVDGRDMPTTVTSGVIASRLHDRSLISEPGKHRIEFFDPPTGRVQHVGEFEVLPRPEPFRHTDGSASAIFCAVEAWGPPETTVGVVQNPQADGSMGLWIKTFCVPPDSAVFLGDVRLDTTIVPDLVTANVPPDLLQSPGTHSVYIRHFGSNERLPLGDLRVLSSR